MVGLVDRLEGWAAGGGHRVTVVFEHPTSIESSLLTIAYAPRAGANSADDEIVRLVATADRPAEITVVTSDTALAHRVRALGAAVQAAAGFRDLIEEHPVDRVQSRTAPRTEYRSDR